MRWLSCTSAALLLMLAGCGDDKPDPAATAELDYRLGFQAIEAHDFAKAAELLSEAAALTPDDPYIQLNLGVAYQNLGQLDKARAAYQHAVETGKDLRPARVTDPHYVARSVADLARDNLASLPPP
jgi:Flp pilus assembly protein TadD